MKSILLIFILLCGQNLTAKDFNILDFGAVRGQLSTAAIQKAVDNCATDGGGRVIVPAGKFITGSIILKSNVNQELSMSCKVDPTRARFSDDFDVVKTAGQLPAQLAFGDHSSFDRA